MAVGAHLEDSAATGINGSQTDNTQDEAGAVYVFVRVGTTWSQQAYVKASNTGFHDWFGFAIALNGNGNTLVVGTSMEDSNATGINGNQADDSAASAGAAYRFTRSGSTWTQDRYIKASNTTQGDVFGRNIALNASGSALVIGACDEDSNATGINGNQANNTLSNSGAAYIIEY
jgi:hypothetical protein